MRVLILGAGIVGYTLADQLSKEKHDIYVIEKNQDLIRDMNDALDIFALCGSGTSQRTLEQIGIQDMDLMIAVTNSDEVNILSCLMANKYGVKSIVARVKNPEIVAEHSMFNKEMVGVDRFINSTMIVVEMLERLIEVPGCKDVAYVGDGQIQIRGFKLSSESTLVGRKAREIQETLAEDAFSLLAITQDGKTFVPDGETSLKEGDQILVLLATHALPMFLPMINRRSEEVRKVVIFGASAISVELAQRLERKYDQVILIEPNLDSCHDMTKVLQKTVIIQGSALDSAILKEVAIETSSVFLCLSPRDEDNVMAAMMAKQLGAQRTVVLAEKPGYLEILGKSNIDIVINPRIITIGSILQFLRRGKVLSAAKLIEGEAEVLEYLIEDGSPIVGRKVGKLHDKGVLAKGARIAAVRDGDVMIIPDDETVLQAGQSVVVFSLPSALEKVQNLFSDRKWKLI